MSRDWCGEQLGAFTVGPLLGEGAYSTVWRGAHVSGHPVALKISHARTEARSSRDEAHQLASLEHPGVVQVFASGTAGEHAWLALELAQGTLRELVSPLPLADLARHLLRTVGHLHAHGVVHRDLKPTNILIGCAPRTGRDAADRGGVRVADFGIARQSGSRGSPSGTQGWAAPEQAQGIVHPSADVYAIALVLQSLADLPTRARIAPWVARATASRIDDRFPSAAHALAALPPIEGRSVGSPEVVPGSGPMETVTRPVMLALVPPTGATTPCAVVEPAWPTTTPVPAELRPRAELLDVGSTLVGSRPTLLVGRQEVLLEAWERLSAGDLVLSGAPVDVEEVREVLRRWIAQTGLSRRVTVGTGGLHVPPLKPWHLHARVEGLGFDAASAVELVRGCADVREVRTRVLQFIRSGLYELTPAGLRVPTSEAEFPGGDLEHQLDEAWLASDGPRLARAVARLRGSEPDRRGELLLAAFEARSEMRRDAATSDRLAALANEACEAGWPEVAVRLLLVGAGVSTRARDPDRTHALLDTHEAVESSDERIRASMVLHRAFALHMQRDEGASALLWQVTELAGGRFRGLAFGTLSDEALQRGDIERALDMSALALEAVDPACPEEAMALRSSRVTALVAAGADEAEISEQLDAIDALSARVVNRSGVARSRLLRAQQAMRLEDWDRADRLLSEGQEMFVRSGGNATFIVLNHGLVGLKRGDLASIRSITPSTWERELDRAPAYVRPLMQLHDVYAALGTDDEDEVEAAFATLDGQTLPEVTREGVEIAARLRPRYAERLRRLLPLPDEP